MSKRILGGLAAASLAFSAFAASAAGLGVSADPLQVGSTYDLACDDNGVRVTVNFGEQQPNKRASQSVTVSDIADECAGAFLTVSALAADGTELGRAQVLGAGISGNTETASWNTGLIDPLLIEGVEVHINS